MRGLCASAAPSNRNAGAAVVAGATKMLEFLRNARLLVSTPEGEISKVSMRGVIDSKHTREFYRNYLVECFQGSGEQSDKLFAQSPLLGQVLGLERAELESVQTELGTVIYRNSILKALKERGALSDEDREFLQSIQEALGMSAELCDALLVGVKKARVAFMVENMFDSSAISEENCAGIRTAADKLGLELASDVEVPPGKLLRMMQCEVEGAIERGEVPADDTSRLAELQEAYGLPQETVTKALESWIEARCKAHLLQAAAAIRQGKAESVLEETEQLLRFNVLNPFKVTSPAVQSNELQVRRRATRHCCEPRPVHARARAPPRERRMLTHPLRARLVAARGLLAHRRSSCATSRRASRTDHSRTQTGRASPCSAPLSASTRWLRLPRPRRLEPPPQRSSSLK
jgi:hypothetical protein